VLAFDEAVSSMTMRLSGETIAAAPNQRWISDTTEFVIDELPDLTPPDRTAVDDHRVAIARRTTAR